MTFCDCISIAVDGIGKGRWSPEVLFNLKAPIYGDRDQLTYMGIGKWMRSIMGHMEAWLQSSMDHVLKKQKWWLDSSNIENYDQDFWLTLPA